MTESGQLDVVAILYEQARTAEGAIAALEDTLNPQIDANPDEKLYMEMLDVASDARESIDDLLDLIQTMRQRDEAEVR